MRPAQVAALLLGMIAVSVAIVMIGKAMQNHRQTVMTGDYHSVRIYKDPQFGCEYLITASGAITPRIKKECQP